MIDEFPERVMVTYRGVFGAGSPDVLDAQVELWLDGLVVFRYLEIPNIPGLVGISPGIPSGVEPPPESDLIL